MLELGRCQAPEGCTRKATSTDHFTPRCLGKLLGWSSEEINQPMNLQDLCQYHHTEKDRFTDKVLQQVKAQYLRNKYIGFGEHV